MKMKLRAIVSGILTIVVLCGMVIIFKQSPEVRRIQKQREAQDMVLVAKARPSSHAAPVFVWRLTTTSGT